MIDAIWALLFPWLMWELYSGILLSDLYNTEKGEYVRPPVSFLNMYLRSRRDIGN